ncbi:hypothetical protein [Caldithrix abyssi]|uniref:hypothetical protein n=1 Tax=Caldithrix abyssi TaxID=187145 RepID=UPI0005C68387|nr:hypothetical protein [Caldithrix abyssi]
MSKNLSNILNDNRNVKRPWQKPKFSDTEVIALSLLSETLMLDSENYLLKKVHLNYGVVFLNLIHKSVYSRRSKPLFNYTAKLNKPVCGQDIFIIDSMSLASFKFILANRLKIFKGNYDIAFFLGG